MTCGTAQPSHELHDRSTKNRALRPEARWPRAGSAAAFLCRAAVVASAIGAAACGWKTDYSGPSSVFPTTVEMQTQDGESLGSKVFAGIGSVNTLTLADVGNRAGLSSKYIVIRRAPLGGVIGEVVAFTKTGSVVFPNSEDGRPLRAIFMSTADLPESVMDRFALVGSAWRYMNVLRVGRVGPGSPGSAAITLLDGDETILTNAIDDINGALVDRQGVSLGRIVWEPNNSSADYHVGFAVFSPPEESWEYYYNYIMINPMEPRDVQVANALGAFFGAFASYYSTEYGVTGAYLADPANGYRISRQGVSLVRFAASIVQIGHQ